MAQQDQRFNSFPTPGAKESESRPKTSHQGIMGEDSRPEIKLQGFVGSLRPQLDFALEDSQFDEDKALGRTEDDALSEFAENLSASQPIVKEPKFYGQDQIVGGIRPSTGPRKKVKIQEDESEIDRWLFHTPLPSVCVDCEMKSAGLEHGTDPCDSDEMDGILDESKGELCERIEGSRRACAMSTDSGVDWMIQVLSDQLCEIEELMVSDKRWKVAARNFRTGKLSHLKAMREAEESVGCVGVEVQYGGQCNHLEKKPMGSVNLVQETICDVAKAWRVLDFVEDTCGEEYGVERERGSRDRRNQRMIATIAQRQREWTRGSEYEQHRRRTTVGSNYVQARLQDVSASSERASTAPPNEPISSTPIVRIDLTSAMTAETEPAEEDLTSDVISEADPQEPPGRTTRTTEASPMCLQKGDYAMGNDGYGSAGRMRDQFLVLKEGGCVKGMRWLGGTGRTMEV